jgi:hypothetical protein
LVSWRSILEKIVRDPASHFIYTRIPPERTTMKDTVELVEPDKCYFKIILSQMFIGYKRRLWQKRMPVVHAFPKFLGGNGTKELPVVIGPNKLLKDLDPNNLEKVIPINQIIVGPVPYFGNDVELVIALFASKTTNYAKEFFSLASSLSDLVPSMGIENALNFLKPMETGLASLLNLKEINLKIGLQDTFSSPTGGNEVVNPFRSGYSCVIAKKEEDIDTENLWLTERGLRVGSGKGKLLEKCDYFVFKIEKVPHRDWDGIKPLQDLWNDVLKMLETRNNDAIEKKFMEFSVALLLNSDLIQEDAEKAHKECRKNLDHKKKLLNIEKMPEVRKEEERVLEKEEELVPVLKRLLNPEIMKALKESSKE